MPSAVAFSGAVPLNYEEYLGPVLFEPYAIDLVERLQTEKLRDVLEIACGTGRLTKHLVDSLDEDGRLTATDLNADMIAIAKTKLDDGRVHWEVANAQELIFADECFDHVVCQFGVMFFPDKLKAFRESLRVLKTGGRYVFNTWDSIANNPRMIILQEALNDVFGSDAPDFITKGPHSFFDTMEIEKLLSSAGFRSINISTVKKLGRYKDPADFVKGFLEGTPLRSYLQNKDEALQKEVRSKSIEGMVKQFDHGLQVPMQAFVCEAIK